MDIDPDKSNTQILIEMVEAVEEVFTNAIAEINKKLDLILGMNASEESSLRDRYRPTEELRRRLDHLLPKMEAQVMRDGFATLAVWDEEEEEEEPTIAERLKAGEILDLQAAEELTREVAGATRGTLVSITKSGPALMVRIKCPSISHDACFTIFNTGKANTGGNGSEVRQVLRDILESQGFDVRC